SARATDVMVQLRPWMLTGFIVMFVTGFLLFWAEAARCYESPTFRAKLAFLVAAGINAAIFESNIGRRVGAWDDAVVPPRGARLAGWISLICWTGVVVFGRWTAYGL